MKPQLRIVASSSERPDDTLRMQRDASSSTTQRLAAFVRRLHARQHLGDLAIGIVIGTGIVLLLRALGAW